MKISALFVWSSLFLFSSCDEAKPAAPAAQAVAKMTMPQAGAQPARPAGQTGAATPAGAQPVATGTPTAAEPAPIPAGTAMKCPVSGEAFTVGSKTPQVVYNGKRYAFCCADCLPEFNKNPAKYANR